MRRLICIFLLLPFWGIGCDDNDDVLPDQQSKFVTYLSSTHDPALLSEQEKEESLDRDPEFYTTAGETVYRYIRHYYDPGRAYYPVVAPGDRVTLTVSMYEFAFQNLVYLPYESSDGKISMPYYSNNADLEQAFYDTGLTEGIWSFEPLVATVGQTPLVRGLELALALPGLRERDTAEVYMTYNMAYGDKPLGIVPKQTPIAMLLTVDRVDKAGGTATDRVLYDQQGRYVSYLALRHDPKLLTEQEAALIPDADPEFYTVTGESVYRYVRNYYDGDRVTRPLVAAGDEVTLTLSMYAFDYTNLMFLPGKPAEEGEAPPISMPFYSNNAELEQVFYQNGLPSGTWTFEPWKVKLGETEILKGLEMALPGLRERDTVEVYMTYNMAYGDASPDGLPEQMPVAVYLTVDEVKKIDNE